LIITSASVFADDLGLNVNAMMQQIQDDADAIIAFETQLAQIITPIANRRNLTTLYNRMTVKEIKEMWPMKDVFNWDMYFFHLLPIQFLNRLNDTSQYFDGFYTLSNDSSVIITDPNYITNLITLVGSSDNRTMANYFLWRMVQSLLPLADN